MLVDFCAASTIVGSATFLVEFCGDQPCSAVTWPSQVVHFLPPRLIGLGETIW